jgi:hypothetical protein
LQLSVVVEFNVIALIPAVRFNVEGVGVKLPIELPPLELPYVEPVCEGASLANSGSGVARWVLLVDTDEKEVKDALDVG